MTGWQAPGARRLVVGVLTPHVADGPEVELPEISEGIVATLVARTAGRPLDGSSTLEKVADLDVLTRAADALVDQDAVALAHTSTTTGYVLGPGGEKDLIDSLGQRCGFPVVSASAAAVHALRRCGAERVTVAHPPWFDDEMDALGAAYFARAGLKARVVTVTGVPRDPASVTPGDLADRSRPSSTTSPTPYT